MSRAYCDLTSDRTLKLQCYLLGSSLLKGLSNCRPLKTRLVKEKAHFPDGAVLRDVFLK